jgi:hypothetical protein
VEILPPSEKRANSYKSYLPSVNKFLNPDGSVQTLAEIIGGGGGVDISSHTVNGVPLSEVAAYYYAVSDTAANEKIKLVSIPQIKELNVGQIIYVQPSIRTNQYNFSIKLNDFPEYPVKIRNGVPSTSGSIQICWRAYDPTAFIFDGGAWHVLDLSPDVGTANDIVNHTSTIPRIYSPSAMYSAITTLIGEALAAQPSE